MIIITSVNVAGLRAKGAADLKSYVADESHLISASSDIAHTIAPAAPNAAPGAPLTPIDTHEDITPEQRKRMQKAILTFASKNVSHLKAIAPGAALPLDGLEVVFASKDAFDAFTDPKRTSLLGPLVKSARALSELVDVLKPFVPGLANNPYIDVVTVLVKFGDTAYQFHADFGAAQKLGKETSPQPLSSRT